MMPTGSYYGQYRTAPSVAKPVSTAKAPAPRLTPMTYPGVSPVPSPIPGLMPIQDWQKRLDELVKQTQVQPSLINQGQLAPNATPATPAIPAKPTWLGTNYTPLSEQGYPFIPRRMTADNPYLIALIRSMM